MFLAFTTETNTLKLQSPLYEFDLAHTCLLLSQSSCSFDLCYTVRKAPEF